MTHHTMNQMGHAAPIMLGVDPNDLNEQMRALLPGYMVMGQRGMGEMGRMRMPSPPNSVSMMGLEAKHGYIDMGGMFTILKVRETLSNYEDPGWYESPPGTLTALASEEELRRDGIATK